MRNNVHTVDKAAAVGSGRGVWRERRVSPPVELSMNCGKKEVHGTHDCREAQPEVKKEI